MKRKSMREFIKEHREDIDKAIIGRPGMSNYQSRLNDDERRMWILNEEGLYNWARSEGVDV